MTNEEYEQRLDVFNVCVASARYDGHYAGLSAALIAYALNPRRTDDEDNRFHSFINVPFSVRYAVLALDCARLDLSELDREFLGRVVAEHAI